MILSFCDKISVLETILTIKSIINILSIIIPIALIVSSVIMIAKNMIEGKDTMLSNSVKSFTTKAIAAVLVFFAPIIVNLVLNLIGDRTEFTSCLNKATEENISALIAEETDELIKKAEKTLNRSDYVNALNSAKRVKDKNDRNNYNKKLEEIKKQVEIKENVEKLINEKKFEEAKKQAETITNQEVKNRLLQRIEEEKKKEEERQKQQEQEEKPPVPPGPEDPGPGTSSDSLEIIFIGSNYYDDAILIRAGSNTIFIDGGRYGAKGTVTPFLKKENVSKIDLLIGSHLHYDHIQTHADILDNFTVSSILYPDNVFDCSRRGSCRDEDQKYIVDALKRHNKTPRIVRPGEVITLGDMTLYFMEPVNVTTSGKYPQNANSFVFILKYKNNSFMFTGDIGLSSYHIDHIKKYAQQFGISYDIDVLKYPHHGNATISDGVLSALTPEYAIVPNNRSPKYPNTGNLTRLRNHNVKTYRQSDSKTGNIYVKSDGKNITIKMDY